MKNYLQRQTNVMGTNFKRTKVLTVKHIQLKEVHKFKFHEHEVIHNESLQFKNN